MFVLIILNPNNDLILIENELYKWGRKYLQSSANFKKGTIFVLRYKIVSFFHLYKKKVVKQSRISLIREMFQYISISFS